MFDIFPQIYALFILLECLKTCHCICRQVGRQVFVIVGGCWWRLKATGHQIYFPPLSLLLYIRMSSSLSAAFKSLKSPQTFSPFVPLKGGVTQHSKEKLYHHHHHHYHHHHHHHHITIIITIIIAIIITIISIFVRRKV